MVENLIKEIRFESQNFADESGLQLKPEQVLYGRH